MMKARKEHGNCEFCGTLIRKGDDWSQGADLDDGWMETKHGMKVRPGQPYQSFHTVCYEFVVGDDEGYTDPNDDLYEVLRNIYGWSRTEDKDWKEIITMAPNEGEHPDTIKTLNEWIAFITPRIAESPNGGD